jgi:hypothetical protein
MWNRVFLTVVSATILFKLCNAQLESIPEPTPENSPVAENDNLVQEEVDELPQPFEPVQPVQPAAAIPAPKNKPCILRMKDTDTPISSEEARGK